MKKIITIFTIAILFACDSGGGADDKVTIDPIVDEAEALGNFPSDAEVVEMEDFVVGGEDLGGTESKDLGETYDDAVDVSVTLPSDLSRRGTALPRASLWINGKIGPLEVPSNLKIARRIPIILGPNYFCFVIEPDSGKKYRSIVVKITRLLAASATKYPASVGSVSFNMVQVNTTAPISFPKGVSETTDTVSTIYSIGETEVSVALFAAVYQWAVDNGKFNGTSTSDPNFINNLNCRYGGASLTNARSASDYYIFNTTTKKFTAVSGRENFPAFYVSWYGAVMFCNWLSEIVYGADEVVYSGITSAWSADATIADYTKRGYRLPTANEWECAARWVGTSAGGRTDLIARGGYYWTPGNYVSGATSTEEAEIEKFAHCGSNNNPVEVKYKQANQLGIYNMSGNVSEWSSTIPADPVAANMRILMNGTYASSASYSIVGASNSVDASTANTCGFRIARTEK